jgi:hypothetical protein
VVCPGRITPSPVGMARRTVVFPIHRMYEVVGGTAKIIAR